MVRKGRGEGTGNDCSHVLFELQGPPFYFSAYRACRALWPATSRVRILALSFNSGKALTCLLFFFLSLFVKQGLASQLYIYIYIYIYVSMSFLCAAFCFPSCKPSTFFSFYICVFALLLRCAQKEQK